MKRYLSSNIFCLVITVFLLCSASNLFAASNLVLINQTSGKPTTLAIANPTGSSTHSMTLQGEIKRNLELMPFLLVVDNRSIPGGAVVGNNPKTDDLGKFALAGVQFLITSNWVSSDQVEIRFFEVTTNNFVFGNRYSVPNSTKGVYDVADTFCADFLEKIIGRGDFFRSEIAFVKDAGPRKKDLWAVRPNGRELRRLTNMAGEILSPSWSFDGRYIVFTHIDKRSHGLGIWDNASKSVKRVRYPGNTVIGPTFMPNNRVAVSLSDGKNPTIYLLNSSFQRDRKLDGSSAIDVSPSIDMSGTKMVFTSNRLGNPHVFLKDLSTGSTKRISVNGKYNTDPAISPDGTVVVFSRMESGGHRIYAYDLITNQEQQITFGPGSDEMPDFSPDSYFIVFMSTRSGKPELYFTTRNGGSAKKVPTGQGTSSFPAWGKKNKQ